MKPGIEEKITRVYQHYDIRRKGRKKKVYGPYWFGYWDDKEGRKRVYIGKELTKGLKRLLAGRLKRTGYKNYAWPGPSR